MEKKQDSNKHTSDSQKLYVTQTYAVNIHDSVLVITLKTAAKVLI